MVRAAAILSLLGACAAYQAQAATIHTKVAILGGGVSGINAARNLSANGIDDFLIIEARNELGGRAQNADFAGIKVELGCNWVQGLGTNPVNQLRKKYKLKTVKNDGDDVVFYNESGKIDFKESMDRFNDAYDKMSEMADKRIKNNQVDLSARVGLDLAGWYPTDALDQAVEYYNFDWEDAEDPERSSMIYSILSDEWTYSNTTFGPDSDGDRFVVDQRGFKYIFIKALEEAMKPNDPRIKLNTKVTEIAYNQKGVTIHTESGDVIKAEYAICTFSLGVLQHKDVKWNPPLPEWKMEGLYAFDMATYTKIFLNFPRQFWDDNQYTVYAHPVKRGYFSVWQNLKANGALNDTDVNIFFVTVTQNVAMQVDAMTDEEVQNEAMKILKSMYGSDIPEPTDILVPRWHSNPLFRGTYSNWPIGELREHHTNMKAPLLNRVFFAGEAMSTEFYGFLQGAWFSGAETGMQVVKCIKTKCAEAEYFPTITNARIQPDYIARRK